MSQVPALRRAVAILRHLAASNRPISAGAIARSGNVPRSSAYELLNVLEELGLVTKVDAGYLLGPGVAELGSAYLRINPLQRVAQKDVRALAERARGVAQLAVIRTGKGPRSVQDLMGELTRVRTQGYAIETGEITPGVWTVAAPVYDAAGRAVAAVGLTLPDSDYSQDRVSEVATMCTRAAANVTQLIGGGLKA